MGKINKKEKRSFIKYDRDALQSQEASELVKKITTTSLIHLLI